MKKKMILMLLAAFAAIGWNVASREKPLDPVAEIELKDAAQTADFARLLQYAARHYNEKGADSWRPYFRQTPRELKVCEQAGLPDPVAESLAVLAANAGPVTFTALQVRVPNVPHNSVYHLDATMLPSQKRVRISLMKKGGSYAFTRIAARGERTR